jgi:hypothetical protein
MTKIHKSAAGYEDWLRGQLQGELVEKDLLKKHKEMKTSAFAFLRATYWRWAELIPAHCPDLNLGPVVLAVGDIHVENYGTWRDADGRLVWGINDFDEAAEMPYAFDLVRLAASALLARAHGNTPSTEAICSSILKGYRKGLEEPEPFVLDRDHAEMRASFVATDKDRAKFWAKMQTAREEDQASPPVRFKRSLDGALPAGTSSAAYWPRSAGLGSLGRPRWVAFADWQGGPVVREAKAIVPSAWCYARPPIPSTLRIADIAQGRYRAPDPWYHLTGDDIAIRRLSPNNHKIEIDVLGASLFEHGLLEDMGCELASAHLGVTDLRAEISSHLDQRKRDWLPEATAKAVALIEADFTEWKAG